MIRADEHGRALGRCIAATHNALSHLAPVGDDQIPGDGGGALMEAMTIGASADEEQAS